MSAQLSVYIPPCNSVDGFISIVYAGKIVCKETFLEVLCECDVERALASHPDTDTSLLLQVKRVDVDDSTDRDIINRFSITQPLSLQEMIAFIMYHTQYGYADGNANIAYVDFGNRDKLRPISVRQLKPKLWCVSARQPGGVLSWKRNDRVFLK